MTTPINILNMPDSNRNRPSVSDDDANIIFENSVAPYLPKGRERVDNKTALSTALRYQFDAPFFEVGDEVISAKEYLAVMMAQAALTGTMDFPSGRRLMLRPKEWLELTKWVYDRIDGKARQAIDVSGGEGNVVNIQYVNNWRAGTDE